MRNSIASGLGLVLSVLTVAGIAVSAERAYESGTVSKVTRQPHSNYEAGNKALLYEIDAQSRTIVAADVSGTVFSDYRKPKFTVGERVQFRTHKDRCYFVYQGKEAKMWLASETPKWRTNTGIWNQPRPQLDRSTLEAALIGLQLQRDEIEVEMADLRRQLAGRDGTRQAGLPRPEETRDECGGTEEDSGGSEESVGGIPESAEGLESSLVDEL